jgi:3-methyladenine DNA glycosylase AlkC
VKENFILEKKKKFLLKNILLDKNQVYYLSNLIKSNFKEFDKNQFEKEVLKNYQILELKQRISHITKYLKKFINLSEKDTIKLFIDSIPKTFESDSFIFETFPCFLSTYCCEKKYLKICLNAFKEFTKVCSGEFDIRFFINKFGDETFIEMLNWSKNENYKIRRLSCEGIRPKLPWAQKINFDYKKPIKILDNLYFDKKRFVVRSVANHLNDISKIDSILVIKTLKKWKLENKQNEKEMTYLINHSLRTLIKKGDNLTLEFLGFNLNPKINLFDFKFENHKIKLNEYLNFSFNIENKEKEKLLIDYIFYYPNNTKKVFKLKNINEKEIQINKKHKFKSMSTKKLYYGKYKIAIQINGKILLEKEFFLIE